VEKTGNYIYARRQKPDGSGGWSWDGYEDLLNSGEQPYATINGNRIYITYTKDSAVYQRIIEVGNENNAWDFLLDYQINTNIISPSEIPFKVEQQLISSGSPNIQSTPITFEQIYERPIDSKSNLEYSSNDAVLADAFISTTPDRTGLGWYRSDASSVDKFLLFLPYVYFKEFTRFSDGYYEVYSNNQVFQFDISYSNVNTYYELSATSGPFYLGFRCNLVHSNLKRVPFVLPPKQRLYLLRDTTIFDLYETNSSNKYGTVHLLGKINSSGSICVQSTPITFEQVYSNNVDEIAAGIQSSGSIAIQSVT
jgi:hypothetical protein